MKLAYYEEAVRCPVRCPEFFKDYQDLAFSVMIVLYILIGE